MSLNKEIKTAYILHLYQPPTQTEKVLERIVHNCYLPLTNFLIENPEVKLTININASLSELLEDKHTSLLEKFAELARNDQIEFLESAAYHAILPLLSDQDARVQINLNRMINKEIFGNIYSPIGFWPPELAVSDNLLSLIESMGYKYTVAPSISLGTEYPNEYKLLSKLPFSQVSPNLMIIPRNKEISNNIAFRSYSDLDALIDHINIIKNESISSNNTERDFTLVCAMDGETFGEHHKNYMSFLFDFLKRVTSLHVKDLLNNPRIEIKDFRSSSWSTSEEDLWRGIPFPLWAYPGNAIHDILNIHLDLLSESLETLLDFKPENSFEVQQSLKAVAKAQYSCQQWWASTKDHYSKELIRTGFNAQKNALMQVLMAIGDKGELKTVQGLSGKLERRLERYLNRIM